MVTTPIVAIDFSEVFFTCIFSNWRMRHTPGIDMVMPVEWMVLRKIFSYIKAYPTHEVYLFADGTHTWRKDVDPNYKANRKDQRDKYEDIDWTDMFQKYADMLSALDLFTPVSVFRDELLEADDLEAILAKDGREIVIFSSDKDLNQLCVYPNVTLISPNKKKIKNKFVVREITEPLKELDKLVRCGDRADNVPSAKTEAQKIINNKLVNLITLPPEIEARARAVLNQPRAKQVDLARFCQMYRYKFVGKEIYERWPQTMLGGEER